MGKCHEQIDERLASWIRNQRMFFVGTAPAGESGHVNVSPKGPIETLRVLGPRRVAYLDVVGSGAETIAHLRQNGRIVLMLCAFEGAPRIVRLHGTGEAVQLGDPRFAGLAGSFGQDAYGIEQSGGRSVILIEVERIADSCGYGVPLMRYEGERPQAEAWRKRRRAQDGPDALRLYAAERNAASIDGLPALDAGLLERRPPAPA